MDVYPLIFQPIFQPRIWGGRRLQSILNKNLPAHQQIGESWEVCDLGAQQTVVANGPAKDVALRALVARWDRDLLGEAPLSDGGFPLLIKYLDARETLSVQVHPSEAFARAAGGEARVKHEAWYVVHAEEGAVIYRGWKAGVTEAMVRRASTSADWLSLLCCIPVRKGSCYLLPSGTVHALGAGLVVAEIQTPSDTTFRLHDWDRVDPATGRPRTLHIEQALACVSFDPVPLAQERRQHLGSVWTSVSSLVRCDAFTVERVRMVEGVEQTIPYDGMVIWMVLEGRGEITCDALGASVSFGAGDTVVLPAGMRNGRIRTLDRCMWLEVSVPLASSLAGYDRPETSALHGPHPDQAPYVPLGLPPRDAGSRPTL